MNTIKEILGQLELCNFTDEIGHHLVNNEAFLALQRLNLDQVVPKWREGDNIFYMRDNKVIEHSIGSWSYTDKHCTDINYYDENGHYVPNEGVFPSKEELLKSL